MERNGGEQTEYFASGTTFKNNVGPGIEPLGTPVVVFFPIGFVATAICFLT